MNDCDAIGLVGMWIVVAIHSAAIIGIIILSWRDWKNSRKLKGVSDE